MVMQDDSLNALDNEFNGISSLEKILEIENTNQMTPPKFSRKTSMKKYRSTFVGHTQSDQKKNVGFVEEGQGNQGNEGINQHKMGISQGNSGSNVPQSNLSIEEPKEEIRKFEMVVDDKKEIKREDYTGDKNEEKLEINEFKYGENTTNNQTTDQKKLKNKEGSKEQENHQNVEIFRLNERLNLIKYDFENEEDNHDNCQVIKENRKQRIQDKTNLSNILMFLVLMIINLTSKIVKGLLRMSVNKIVMIFMECVKSGMVFGGMVVVTQVRLGSKMTSFIKCVLKFNKK